MAHLDEHKLLSDWQHAFREKHSCETQLITVINDWAKILDMGRQVDTFILEFEKASTTPPPPPPPHELLKCTLYGYGIGGKSLKWIDSFLCDRQQCVVVNGVKADWTPVLSCVPQGTILEPLLCWLYINDITKGTDSELRLFADDCVCYRKIKNSEDTVKLQEDRPLRVSGKEFGYAVPAMQCSIMQITRKRIKKITASYTFEGMVLDNVEKIKYLDITITNDLKWNTHVSNICTKAIRTLGFLGRNLAACPQTVKESTYKRLLRPVLGYGSSLWDPQGILLLLSNTEPGSLWNV